MDFIGINAKLLFLLAKMLLSTAEKTTSAGVSTNLNCNNSLETALLKDEYYDFTTANETLLFQNVNLTVVILQEGQTATAALMRHLPNFHQGFFTKSGFVPEESFNQSFGLMYSRGSEYVYVPFGITRADLEYTRIFYENYLLKSVRGFRFIVLLSLDRSNDRMSPDAAQALRRLASIAEGRFLIDLVVIMDTGSSLQMQYNFSRFSSYVERELKSCESCAKHSLRLHLQREKSFSSIKYGHVRPRSLGQIFSQNIFSKELREKYKLMLLKLRCSFLRMWTDATWEADKHMQSHTRDLEGLYNLYKTEMLFLALIHGKPSKDMALGNQMILLKKYDASRCVVKKSNSTHLSSKPAAYERNEFLGRRNSFYLNAVPETQVGEALTDAEDISYGKNREVLSDVFASHGRRSNEILAIEDFRNDHSIQDANVACIGDTLVITGCDVQLQKFPPKCSFRSIIVKAGNTLHIGSSVRLSGKNMMVYAPKVISSGSPSINLSGRDCHNESGTLSGENGGHFKIYSELYEGSPLKIVSNGGKGCDINETSFEVDGIKNSSDRSKICNSINESATWGSGGLRGFVRVVSLSSDSFLDDHIIKKSSDGENGANHLNCKITGLQENINSRKNEKRSAVGARQERMYENDYMASLTENERMQVFLNYAMRERKTSGRNIVKQMEILNRYAARKKDGTKLRKKSHQPFVQGKTSSDSEQCFDLIMATNYRVRCAIDVRDSNETNTSEYVNEKLQYASVAVMRCLQVNLPLITEFDLVVCNVTVHGKMHRNRTIVLDDRLQCFNVSRVGGKTIACHRKRGNRDFGNATDLLVDYARAILAVRHILFNPLPMIHAPMAEKLADATAGNTLDILSNIFMEAYTSLIEDYETYTSKILRPTAERATAKLHDTFFYLLTKLKNDMANEEDVAELIHILRLVVYIKIKVLNQKYTPRTFANLALSQNSSASSTAAYVQGVDLEEMVFERISSFAFYLKMIHSEVNGPGYPPELRDQSLDILIHYSEKVRERMTDDRDEEITRILNDLIGVFDEFSKQFLDFRSKLHGQLLESFDKTAGKYVWVQNDLMDVLQGIMLIIRTENEMEMVLPYALKMASRANATLRTFFSNFESENPAAKDSDDPGGYPINNLYNKILATVTEDRRNLTRNLNHDSLKNLKFKMETAFDLKREVFRSLQTVVRIGDVKRLARKLENQIHPKHDSKTSEVLHRMRLSLDDHLLIVASETLKADFHERIFPFGESLNKHTDSETDLKSLATGLRKAEQAQKTKWRHQSFDPNHCNHSCHPFYSWTLNELKEQGQDIDSLFSGRGLFLLADVKNIYDHNADLQPVKGKDFGIRLTTKNGSSEIEKILDGTQVLLQQAAFSYSTHSNLVYFSSSKSFTFRHVMGRSFSRERLAPADSGSPYTMWRIQLLNVTRDADQIRDLITGIELIGEGEVLRNSADVPATAKDTLGGEKPPIWQDVYFTLFRDAEKHRP